MVNSTAITLIKSFCILAYCAVTTCKCKCRTGFYKFGRNRNETESGNVVSAENETDAEFKTLFRPKPKPKISNTECITYVYNPKRIGYFNVPSVL